jgi:uncharacterized protein Yka (UPF0111/DUF47 family)
MLSISRLLPSEGKFFRLLERLCAQTTRGAQELRTLTESTDGTARGKAAQEISAAKQEAKLISAEITRELCLTFITPFDRDDIQNFAFNLYKISKTIEKVSAFMRLHQVSDLSDLAAQAGIIAQEAEAMERVVKALITGAGPEQIMAKAASLDALENKGDEILSDLLVKLISSTPDARQLILKKDLYDMLEKVIDRYRDAAGVAIQIALKHT